VRFLCAVGHGGLCAAPCFPRMPHPQRSPTDSCFRISLHDRHRHPARLIVLVSAIIARCEASSGNSFRSSSGSQACGALGASPTSIEPELAILYRAPVSLWFAVVDLRHLVLAASPRGLGYLSRHSALSWLDRAWRLFRLVWRLVLSAVSILGIPEAHRCLPGATRSWSFADSTAPW